MTEKTSDITAAQIVATCDDIKGMLLDKNRAYGNSALDPVRIFSKCDPSEQIKVRIDDKLSRLINQSDKNDDKEDTLKDLIGYLILLHIYNQNDELANRNNPQEE